MLPAERVGQLTELLDLRCLLKEKHLADRSRGRHLRRSMKRWSWHRTRALLLAVSLGLGMSLSFVQGSVMAAGIIVAADGAHHGPSGCDGCGGGDHKADAGMCLSVCGSPAQGLVPGEPVALLPASRANFQAVWLVVGGRCHSPDHGPPKTLTLG